jgi:alginate O-acetyltransferase complex protein AlgJ
MADRNHRIDRITIALFVIVLCAPFGAWVFGVADNRNAVRFELDSDVPRWQWDLKSVAKYPRQLQDYFNTHFRFRDELTALHGELKVGVFGTTSSDRVTLGTDGWLFYAGEETLVDYQRTRPFSDAELAEWARVLVQRRDWLRARGIPFVFTIAPNAQSIYPEFVPDSISRAPRPSRRRQLISYLAEHTDLDVIDLEPLLLDAKRTQDVYYKTDTHWNQLGGFVAYRALATWLAARFPELRATTLADYDQVTVPNWSGSLGYFLGVPSRFTEPRIELRTRDGARPLSDGDPLSFDESHDSWYRRDIVVRESATGEIPRAVILRDSQYSAPGQFLSRHFRRSVLVWRNYLDPIMIERERPNVVIQEIAERLLMAITPTNPGLP